MVASTEVEGGVPSRAAAGLGRPFSISRIAVVAVTAAALVLGAAALAYIFRGQLEGTFETASTQVIWAVGLGIVPLGLWIAALVVAAMVRRSILTNYRMWAASFVLAVAAVVAMSGITTGYGSTLDVMTNNGEVSLGGAPASLATNGWVWLAALEAAVLAIVATSIAWPRTAQSGAVAASISLRRMAVLLGPLARTLMAMLGSALALLWRATASVTAAAWSAMASATSGMRSAARGSRSEEDIAGPEQDHSGATSGDLAWSSATDTIQPTYSPQKYDSADNWVPMYGLEPEDDPDDDTNNDWQLPVSEPESAQIDEWDESEELSPEQEEEPGVSVGVADPPWDHPLESSAAVIAPARQPTNGAKVNRYWDDAEDTAAVDDPVPEQVERFAVDSEVPTDAGPILDRWASKWTLPKASILKDLPVEGITKEEMKATSATIQATLADYGVEVAVRMTRPGPTVTMYGLEPGWIRRHKQETATDESGKPLLNEAGRQVRQRVETKTRVKVDSILQREKDLALALQTASIRIDSPVMGTSLVGIEVPNASPELVTLRYVMKSPEFRKIASKAALPIALGKGSGGETAVLDMAKLPHLLVAGATGSGKSVCLNTIVSCLTMEKSPSELRLLLVDPKRVELTPYNGLPHLLTPVVVDTDEVVPLLKALISEMFKRYRHLEREGVRNIASYNERARDKMPYLMLVVDELADLMMTSSMEVEQALCRLAQLGRATGIHLVIATQRPSVDVLTGLIKANFPSRIAFGVTSQIDSRTILDSAGAEKLLGRGDMLYQPIDASRPARVQGVFISDEEVRSLVAYWKLTKWAPMPEAGLEIVEDGDDARGNGTASTGDDLMDRAIELAHSQRKLSTSMLQRKLRIGYPRAARLMDELEEQGVVGPGDGSKPRDVILG